MGAGDPAARAGCLPRGRAGVQVGSRDMRYFLPNDYPLLLSAAGDGRWQRGPSPGLAVEAAGVIPVASGRSCQSGQTPPHANVASQRAYATLARANATWATVHHPRSLLRSLHPPGPCPPPAHKGSQAGQEETRRTKRTQWRRLSSRHHFRVFSPAEETDDGATGLGKEW